MKKTKIFLSAMLFCMIGCKKPFNQQFSEEDLTFKYQAKAYIIDQNTWDTLSSIKLQIAETDLQIAKGLMWRDSLLPNQGMLFLLKHNYQAGFYMKNTSIPLDIIYIDSTNSITQIYENTIPYSDSIYQSYYVIDKVIEVPAGTTSKNDWKAGDHLIHNRIK
ncbi:DUF192 domain-containing protein [Nonlabens sp. SCSIO 43208]|uniref:DUF192 domain-containing protein n=1 Tax=Nonlabens sp. SCSIO 43208 TaxID=2793009 RepID=UPI003D6A8B2A